MKRKHADEIVDGRREPYERIGFRRSLNQIVADEKPKARSSDWKFRSVCDVFWWHMFDMLIFGGPFVAIILSGVCNKIPDSHFLRWSCVALVFWMIAFVRQQRRFGRFKCRECKRTLYPELEAGKPIVFPCHDCKINCSPTARTDHRLVAKEIESSTPLSQLNDTLGKVCGLPAKTKVALTRCVQGTANDHGIRQCKPEIDMDSMLLRCRHLRVKWLTSHSCQCANCGKHGHWFENEGLVMWVRQESKSVPAVAATVASSPGHTFAVSQNPHSLPSRAG